MADISEFFYAFKEIVDDAMYKSHMRSDPAI